VKSYLYAAVITVLTVTSATAQPPKSYFCEVVKAYDLSDSGVLRSLEDKKGERFQVNIKTGEMTGDYFSSSSWARTSVIDPGTSPKGSYVKVLYSSPPDGEFVNVGYLELQGRVEQRSRPFLYNYGPSLFSGVCGAAF
jgi:hypothetical protein